MVYSGKIYETDGAQAVAVHEAETVRPLSPVPNAPSIRIFRSDLQPGIIAGMDLEEPYYLYSNPTALLGASQTLPFPVGVGAVSVETFLAAVAVSDALQIPVETADDIILGFTIVTLLVSRTYEAAERKVGAMGRSHDLGGVIGPVLTTPDEVEEMVVAADQGRRYDLPSVLRVNGVERGRGNTELLPFTAAQAISAASQYVPVRSGDIFAFGPVATAEEPVTLDPGDEIQVSIDKLGTLSVKLSQLQ
jgi:2-keto-4-pentenoate hydratase/2-oxohepta-3-ene-1,7-dioic acid hydratase in catechol pathway